MKKYYQKVKKKFIAFKVIIATCCSISWKASPFYTMLRLGGTLIPALLAVVSSMLGKYLLDILAGAWKIQNPYSMVFGITAGILLITICSAAIQKAGQYAQSMHEEIMSGTLSLTIMERASKADIEYFDNPKYYDKLIACTRDISAVEFLLWNAISAFSACISFCTVFLILSRANVVYSLIIVAAAVPSSIASAKYIRLMYHLSLEQMNEERKKGYLQSLTINREYVKSIKLFDIGLYLRDKYQRIWKTLLTERKKLKRPRTVLTVVLECLPEVAAVGIGLSLSVHVLQGAATVGDYSLYSGLVGQLWSSVYIFSSAVMQILDNHLKIKNLKSLDLFENHVRDNGKRTLSGVDSIVFEHVSFSYPGTEKQILQDISFMIRPKEKVALVGLNGSGKSTVIKLLLRFYDADQGTIMINGADIQEYRLQDLRKNFSVYFQDEPSYSFSLRENTMISDLLKDDGEDAVTKALHACGGEDILNKSPNGLDTELTRLFDEEGLELSIGQYQKIALARVFYRRHTALILDEPSSSLDPKAEHMLFEQLKGLTQDKTVLFTSHRLTNISLAERIIVLEHGMIIEDGTQENLLKLGGRYAELFHYQQEHFKLLWQKERENEHTDSID